jgi:methionyl-tRNA formyltransferase
VHSPRATLLASWVARLVRVLVAATNAWNATLFEDWSAKHANRYSCRLVQTREELTADAVTRFAPDFVFVVHWSWKVPRAIYAAFECIGFHMTDLPYGRGGSPLQNLIQRGTYATQLSAFRVTGAVDAGSVYAKRPLCLHGTAQEIYIRASTLAFEMMDEIITTRPAPIPQPDAQTTTFQRRRPRESEVPTSLSLVQLYDFVRMLDADGYPHAFVKYAGFRFELTRASLRDGHIVADVRIVPDDASHA